MSMARIKRYLLRRRLRTVVAVLPFALAQRYGNCDFYTPAQALVAIDALRIKTTLLISAVSASPR